MPMASRINDFTRLAAIVTGAGDAPSTMTKNDSNEWDAAVAAGFSYSTLRVYALYFCY
jgi:hypothetical protein